jgi:GT2 family glycosyltransferase
MPAKREPAASANDADARGRCLSISLIICAYTLDRWQDVCEAVASVQAMSRRPDEIILVSDHNDELLAKMQATFGNLCVIANEEARGLSGARNTGVRRAKGQLVAFLDDDAVAAQDWLSALERVFQSSDVIGATSRIDPIWLGTRPAWFPSEFLWTVGCSYKGLPETRSEVRNLMGAAMCFRRDVFDAAGGFTHNLGRTHSRLPLSCEETEFSIRARRALAGARFVFDPASIIGHKVPQKRLTLGYFLLRCYAEGVSKQRLTALVSSRGTLSTETSYVLNVLPGGALRGLSDTFLRGDIGGIGRAVAIVLGFSAAATGYLLSTSRDLLHRRPLKSRITSTAKLAGAGFDDAQDH